MNKYLIILIATVLLASCKTSRNIQTESLNLDSIVNSVKKKSQLTIDSLNLEHSRKIQEMTNIGATFTPCPPASVPDSILAMLDSGAKYRILLWQKDQKIQALNTKIKVNADGSFETNQQVQSLSIAKSRTEDENISLKHSNSVLTAQLDSSNAQLKREQQSKSVVKSTSTGWAWWIWFVIGFLSCGALFIDWKKLIKIKI